MAELDRQPEQANSPITMPPAGVTFDWGGSRARSDAEVQATLGPRWVYERHRRPWEWEPGSGYWTPTRRTSWDLEQERGNQDEAGASAPLQAPEEQANSGTRLWPARVTANDPLMGLGLGVRGNSPTREEAASTPAVPAASVHARERHSDPSSSVIGPQPITTLQVSVRQLAADASRLLELFIQTAASNDNDDIDEHAQSLLRSAAASIAAIQVRVRTRRVVVAEADCVVCYAERADRLFMPCKHLVVCSVSTALSSCCGAGADGVGGRRVVGRWGVVAEWCLAVRCVGVGWRRR